MLELEKQTTALLDLNFMQNAPENADLNCLCF